MSFYKSVDSITKPTLPGAMIDGIRRRLESIDGDSWGADKELQPETAEYNELPTDAAVLVAATHATGRYIPAGPDAPDYYRSLVSTAIDNGGRHGNHMMSIPWLRMILAGLEMRPIDQETMWEGFDAGSAHGALAREVTAYDDLFPAEVSAAPAPNAP